MAKFKVGDTVKFKDNEEARKVMNNRPTDMREAIVVDKVDYRGQDLYLGFRRQGALVSPTVWEHADLFEKVRAPRKKKAEPMVTLFEESEE